MFDTKPSKGFSVVSVVDRLELEVFFAGAWSEAEG